MKVVIDCNVLVSAARVDGTCRAVIDTAVRQHTDPSKFCPREPSSTERHECLTCSVDSFVVTGRVLPPGCRDCGTIVFRAALQVILRHRLIRGETSRIL